MAKNARLGLVDCEKERTRVDWQEKRMREVVDVRNEEEEEDDD